MAIKTEIKLRFAPGPAEAERGVDEVSFSLSCEQGTNAQKIADTFIAETGIYSGRVIKTATITENVGSCYDDAKRVWTRESQGNWLLISGMKSEGVEHG